MHNNCCKVTLFHAGFRRHESKNSTTDTKTKTKRQEQQSFTNLQKLPNSAPLLSNASLRRVPAATILRRFAQTARRHRSPNISQTAASRSDVGSPTETIRRKSCSDSGTTLRASSRATRPMTHTAEHISSTHAISTTTAAARSTSQHKTVQRLQRPSARERWISYMRCFPQHRRARLMCFSLARTQNLCAQTDRGVQKHNFRTRATRTSCALQKALQHVARNIAYVRATTALRHNSVLLCVQHTSRSSRFSENVESTLLSRSSKKRKSSKKRSCLHKNDAKRGKRCLLNILRRLRVRTISNFQTTFVKNFPSHCF